MIEFVQPSTEHLTEIGKWHSTDEFNLATGAGKGEPAVALARQYLYQMATEPPENTRFVVAIEGETVLGYVVFGNMSDRHRLVELHIAINPEKQRQGLGREILTMAVDRCFERGQAYRIEFRPMTRNKAAYELARSLGFTKEGATKASLWMIGVGPQNQWIMRMLRPEWEALRAKKAS